MFWEDGVSCGCTTATGETVIFARALSQPLLKHQLKERKEIKERKQNDKCLAAGCCTTAWPMP